MLFLLIIWFVLGVITWTVGTGLMGVLRWQGLTRLGDRAIVAAWLGALILAALMLATSLVLPLSFGVGMTVIIICAGLALLRAETRRELQQGVGAIAALAMGWKVSFFALAIGLAFLGSQTVYWSDTGLYHYQAISWFAQHGTVPGLALIHNRFSTSSSWFALIAPFNHGVLTERISSVTGGFAYLLGLLQWQIHCRRLINRTAQRTDWFAALGLFFILPTCIKLTIALSSSHDQPMILMCIVCTWLLLHFSQNAPQYQQQGSQLILVLSLLSTMVRLSAMPLILMAAVFYWFAHPRKLRATWQIPTLSTLLLSPFLAFNGLASGCLLYPLSVLCFDWPWAVGKESAGDYQDFIREWNQWYFPWDIPDNPEWGEWILPWVKIEKPLLLLLISSAILLLLLLKSPRFLHFKNKYYLVGVAVFGMLYTVYSAPSWRFCVGYACLLPLLYLAELCHRSPRNLAIAVLACSAGANSWWDVSPSLLLVTTLTVLLTGLCYGLLRNPTRQRLALSLSLLLSLCLVTPLRDYSVTRSVYPLVWHPGLPPALSETYPTDQFTPAQSLFDVHYRQPSPELELCWSTELPCTHELTHDNIRLRNPSQGLAGGFVRVEPD
ncbi:MAG: hypothetical protein AAGG51_00220 [Cyanobacteria bacterium P01_G01_bin.54]